MDFAEYQKAARRTMNQDLDRNTYTYLLLGLMGESGEVADKVKKHIRDEGKSLPSELSDEQREDLARELGDVLWYVSQLSSEIGYTFEDVARLNIEKLRSRKERGTLSGSGDNR